jgi:hypothetical protein
MGKIIVNCISEKYSIFRIYKEPQKQHQKQITQLKMNGR